MKHGAILRIKSKNPKIIEGALAVDNKTAGQRIASRVEKDYMIARVESDSINTLLATLDDMIYCQMVSESVMEDG